MKPYLRKKETYSLRTLRSLVPTDAIFSLTESSTPEVLPVGHAGSPASPSLGTNLGPATRRGTCRWEAAPRAESKAQAAPAGAVTGFLGQRPLLGGTRSHGHCQSLPVPGSWLPENLPRPPKPRHGFHGSLPTCCHESQ